MMAIIMAPQLWANGIIAGSVYALIALGFAVSYLPTRFFNFAYGGVYAWGAYLAYLCHVVIGMPLWLAIILAVCLSGLLGVLTEVIAFRKLRQREATNLAPLLASMGVYLVLQNLISLIFSDQIKSLRSGPVVEGFALFGARITPIQFWMVFVSAGCFVFILIALRITSCGRALRAVACEPELAAAVGIDVNRIMVWAVAVGSALAGAAAILVALDVELTPTMGLNAMMMGVVAAIVGGIRSIPGTLLGGMLLGLVQQLGVWKIGSQWQDSIAFLLLIVFFIARPQGFLGAAPRKATV